MNLHIDFKQKGLTLGSAFIATASIRLFNSASAVLVGVLMFSLQGAAQSKGPQKTSTAVEAPKSKVSQRELSEDQLPAFAISLVISLANDARSYEDQALRPRVLAQAGDVLWEADNVTARSLFKRAWDEAEKGDADEVTIKTKDNPPAMAMALRRISGRDLRFEVLSVVARRDRQLSEEFLAKLKSDYERESNGSDKSAVRDDWFLPAATARRLQVASELLKQGETERAIEFAAPALTAVNVHTIGFLSQLRVENAAAADRMFATLLTQAEFDPAVNANTVSGLSSYVFTPGLYVTFNPEGGLRWTQPDETPSRPTDFPGPLRDRFFQVATTILLRPLQPGSQFSASEHAANQNVIKRLLPLFEQYVPETAAALRTRLLELTSGVSRQTAGTDHFMLAEGIQPQLNVDDVLQRMQSQLDRAKTSRERDQIYAATAATFGAQGDERARDIADKIDDSARRAEVVQYVDFEFVQRAIRKKATTEAIRRAKAGNLTNTQRAAAYLNVAPMLRDREPQRALELLEDAVREIHRIESKKLDRPLLLIGVVNQLAVADRIRAWEIMQDVLKEANLLEGFTGKEVITFPLMTRSSVRFINIGGENFSLSNVFSTLAKDDLHRAIDLAKSFKYDAPRASATLSIARSILQKRTAQQD